VPKISKAVKQYVFLYKENKKKFYSKIFKNCNSSNKIETLQDPSKPDETSNKAKKKLNWIHKYFSQVYKSKINLQNPPPWLRSRIPTENSQKLLVGITEQELKDAIKHLKNYTAPGEDRVPPELYEAI